jgi:hypothetical protein
MTCTYMDLYGLIFVTCAEAVLLLIMKADFETKLYFKTISKILAVGTSTSTAAAGNGESESRTPFARTRKTPQLIPCLALCTSMHHTRYEPE